MAKPAMQASSADRGFFQEVPLLRNQAHEDVAFQRVIKREFFLVLHVAKSISLSSSIFLALCVWVCV